MAGYHAHLLWMDNAYTSVQVLRILLRVLAVYPSIHLLHRSYYPLSSLIIYVLIYVIACHIWSDNCKLDQKSGIISTMN
jgi:hypothetical protein